MRLPKINKARGKNKRFSLDILQNQDVGKGTSKVD